MSSVPNFKLCEIQIHSQQEDQDPKKMPLRHSFDRGQRPKVSGSLYHDGSRF